MDLSSPVVIQVKAFNSLLKTEQEEVVKIETGVLTESICSTQINERFSGI